MTRLLAGLITMAALWPMVISATPTFTVQGQLKTQANLPAPDGKYALTFSLYDKKDAKKAVYEEVHAAVGVINGVFHAEMGAKIELKPTLLDAPDALWLGVTPGGDPEFSRVRLGWVPYAVRAMSAGKLMCKGCVSADHLNGNVLAEMVTNDSLKVTLKTYATLQDLTDALKGNATNADVDKKIGMALANALKGNATKQDITDALKDNAKLSDITKALAPYATLAHLDTSLKNYLPLAGGTLSGALVAKGGADLSGSLLTGARLANIDIAKTPCDANHRGHTGLSSKDAALYFCNGTSWHQVSSCKGSCATQSSGAPVGTVSAWMTNTPPPGYLECDGSAISKTKFKALFAAIGTRYGSPNASLFSLPDFRGQFLRGWNHGANQDPDVGGRSDRGDGTNGDNVGTKQAHMFASHKHKIGRWVGGNPGYQYPFPDPKQDNALLDDGGPHPNVSASGGNETRPRNVNVMWIIKH